MKAQLRSLFNFILEPLEAGASDYHYERSHRTILLGVGALFSLLATGVMVVGVIFAQLGALLPAVCFLALGLFCIIVASLGNDRAVAKVWGKA